MKSLIFKLFFTLIGGFFILLFAMPWGYFNLEVPFSGPEYKLGLDLSWGIELDYKVDLSKVQEEEWYNAQRKTSVIEGLKSIIDRRIETLGINDSVITNSSYGWEEHIIVQIPLKWNDELQSSENIERAKAAIWKVVTIEFKELRWDITQEDINERRDLANSYYEELSTSWEDFLIEAQRISDSSDNITVGTSIDMLTEFSTLSGTWELLIFAINDNNYASELLEVQNIQSETWYLTYYKNEEDIYQYMFIGAEPSIWIAAQDSQGRVLNDKYFVNSSARPSESFQPLVELTFNTDGAEIFGELTRRLVGEPMAIFVGGELLTAPTINEPILSGRAVVSGQPTLESARQLSDDINIWVVPAPIYLTSERTIDARLGQSSLEKIIYSGLFGFSMILIFLIFVYRLSGLIAALALFIYVVITLAILKQFWIVLTLASIAWLVLSIGIAIDANIIIFERIKDEMRKGKSLRDAVSEWFDRSFSAIWDANLTWLIVSIILFIFGINMIKWFWFILWLWIIVSLFSVFFISRIFIRILSRSDISKVKFIWKL